MTLKSEAKAILSWLVTGAKRWAKADGHAEPLPEQWLKFLDEVFPNKKTINQVQKFLGQKLIKTD